MIITCKHCGAALKVDDAKMPSTAFRVKCRQCQNLLTVEPPKAAAGPHPVTPIPVEPMPRSATGEKPVATAGRPQASGRLGPKSSAAVATEPEPEAKPLAPRSHYLQKIKLFSALSYEECRALEGRLKTREFPPNMVIVKEGGPGDSMFFINAGLVEVRKRDPNTGIDFLLTELKPGACFGEMALLTGKPRFLLTELKPGACFGEMALLTGKPRTATVSTMEPTMCAVLEQSDFEDLLLSSPKIGLAMSRVLAERLEDSNQQAGIEYVNLRRLAFDPRVLSLLPQQMILQHKILPAGFANNRLTLAMVNPNNLIALDDVR